MGCMLVAHLLNAECIRGLVLKEDQVSKKNRKEIEPVSTEVIKK